jgi:hypothetical protein
MLPPLQCIIKRAQLSNTNQYLRVDAALPGKHTRQLYDRLSWKEASVLAQLRTGMARLNGYLFRIDVAQTDRCSAQHSRRLLPTVAAEPVDISM